MIKNYFFTRLADEKNYNYKDQAVKKKKTAFVNVIK